MEFSDHGNPRYVPDAEDFAGFLSRVREEADGRGLSPGTVPVSRFFLVQDAQILGNSRIRHELNPELEHEGGNIGYDIRPSARRRGLGTILLRLTLERAAARGLARVRIMCDADNIGSIRVIEKNGGVLDAELPCHDRPTLIRQYWIALTGALPNQGVAADGLLPPVGREAAAERQVVRRLTSGACWQCNGSCRDSTSVSSCWRYSSPSRCRRHLYATPRASAVRSASPVGLAGSIGAS
jgi:predicted acetyltransferase